MLSLITEQFFINGKFETFMKLNGIRHVKSVPYHLSNDGLAECAIQTLKGNLQKSNTGPLETRISLFLLNNILPHMPCLEFLQQSSSWHHGQTTPLTFMTYPLYYAI